MAKKNILERNEAYAELMKRSKETWRRLGIGTKTFSYEQLLISLSNIAKYIDDTKAAKGYLTTAGMVLASGVSKETLARILAGERDYLAGVFLEQHGLSEKDIKYDETPPYVVVEGTKVPVISLRDELEKLSLQVEEQTEERLYKHGRTGDIFALKAVHGWKDGTNGESKTIHNTLVIASKEQAEEAIKLLK